jgi:hypothetical protein
MFQYVTAQHFLYGLEKTILNFQVSGVNFMKFRPFEIRNKNGKI